MFINPKTAIEKGWIMFPEGMSEEMKQKCLQPNAVDITADHVHVFTQNTLRSYENGDVSIEDLNRMTLSESTKIMRKQEPLQPIASPETNYVPFWHIEGNSCVDVMTNFHVTVPAGAVAMLIARSTLARNGLFISSGLYDSGFDNYVGFMLHNRGPRAFIAPGTRIGQLYFVAAEVSGMMYQGQYNANKGEHWSKIEDK